MRKLTISVMCVGLVLCLNGCCCEKPMFSKTKTEVGPRPMMVGKKWSVNETYTGLDKETSRVTF